MGTNGYCKISSQRIDRIISELKADIFIKLSDEKFIKIINSDEEDPTSILEKYKAKGIHAFYITVEDFSPIKDSIQGEISDSFEKLEKGIDDQNEVTDLLLNTIEDVKDLVVNLGVTEHTANLIVKAVENTEKQYANAESMEALFELLMSREGYIKEHGYLTGFIASALAKEMQWNTDGFMTKILTAALFQNLSLETDDQAKIYHLEGEAFEALDGYGKELVERHPFLSSDLIDSGDMFGDTVKKLILCHHEQPDNSGFPGRLNANSISPIEAGFVISVNFAHRLMVSGDPKNAPTISQEMSEIFYVGSYKKVFEGFLKTFRSLNS